MKVQLGKRHIRELSIDGYKSIRKAKLELGMLTVLIGSNGAGKSNLISVFMLVRQIVDQKLQLFVGKHGGPDAMLHYGRKTTDSVGIGLKFGQNGYAFRLTPTLDNRMLFEGEWFHWDPSGTKSIGSGHEESKSREGTRTDIDKYVLQALESWKVYHFHDTSDTSRMKQKGSINDNTFLREDAANLAAFLYRLQRRETEAFRRIEKVIRSVAPFFECFVLRPDPLNPDRIQLEWQNHRSEEPLTASYLSDGTLRFICLATLLLQPLELRPATLIIDEPELGLHPYAILKLGAMVRAAALETQIILSTQSADLLSEFDAEDIIVVDREQDQSVFRRMDSESLRNWLDDEYSLGELWKKNLLGGRPG